MLKCYRKNPEARQSGNHGAIWLSAVLYLGTWAFGVHVDVWTTGYDVMLCLGPWQPRLIWIPGVPQRKRTPGP